MRVVLPSMLFVSFLCGSVALAAAQDARPRQLQREGPSGTMPPRDDRGRPNNTEPVEDEGDLDDPGRGPEGRGGPEWNEADGEPPPPRGPDARRPGRDLLPPPGPGGPRPPRGPRPPSWREMSDKQRGELHHFMDEHFPRMVVELDRLKESAPKRYERRMERVAPEMRRLMDIGERDPHRATVMIRERQVGLQLQQLARNYQAASEDDEKARIRKSVRELASQEFDNRLERRNMEVRQLETKLAELKSRLSEMESVREDMLDRRTRELLERKPKRDGDEADDRPANREPRGRRDKDPD